MSILKRFTRMLRADVHGLLDMLEDKSLLLKQCLRDMEEDLESERCLLGRLRMTKEHTDQQLEQKQTELENFEHGIQTAMERGEDRLARLLIRRRISTEAHIQALIRQHSALDKELERALENHERRRMRYEEIKLRTDEYSLKKERTRILKTTNAAEALNGLEDPWNSAPTEAAVELELLRRKGAMGMQAGPSMTEAVHA